MVFSPAAPTEQGQVCRLHTSSDAYSNDAMTSRAPDHYQIYPAKYFSASPTYFAWIALTAHDVHRGLQSREGFEGQNLYFILNHPIKFVRVVGLIIGIEVLGNGKYLLLNLDDGSGSTIECKAQVRQPGRRDDVAEAKRVKEEWPSTTLVDNLDCNIDLGELKVRIDRQPVDIGTVVKAKGTIDTFRQQRQLKLERIRVVKDTNEEAKAWRETAAQKANVLSKPWVLTDEKKAEVDLKLARERAEDMEKTKKRRIKDAKWAEKKRRHEEKKEKRRVALEGRFDEGALTRSAVLPDRFTDS